MTDLKALAAAALGTTPDNIHTAVEVGDELVALDRNLAKYRWPMAVLVAKHRGGSPAETVVSSPTMMRLSEAIALALPPAPRPARDAVTLEQSAEVHEIEAEAAVPGFDEPLESQETPVETEESILVEPTEPETEEPSLANAADEPPVKKSRRR